MSSPVAPAARTSPIRQRGHLWLVWLRLVCLCALTAQCVPAQHAVATDGQPAAEHDIWVENASLTIRLTVYQSTGNPSAAATADSAVVQVTGGEVFDSIDYQSLLLLPSQWDRAFVVDLESGQATAYDRQAVLTEAGHVVAPPPNSGQSVGIAIADAEGRLCLSNGDWELVVEAAPPLVGPLARKDLVARQPVYGRRVHAYEPEPIMVDIIAASEQPIEILAFFGTWCSTCKEHLPALFAVLDRAANDKIQVTCVGVDEYMAEPAGLLFTHEVQATPTFIVLADGTEIGRIEDEPEVSMESDLVDILLDWEEGNR